MAASHAPRPGMIWSNIVVRPLSIYDSRIPVAAGADCPADLRSDQPRPVAAASGPAPTLGTQASASNH